MRSAAAERAIGGVVGAPLISACSDMHTSYPFAPPSLPEFTFGLHPGVAARSVAEARPDRGEEANGRRSTLIRLGYPGLKLGSCGYPEAAGQAVRGKELIRFWRQGVNSALMTDQPYVLDDKEAAWPLPAAIVSAFPSGPSGASSPFSTPSIAGTMLGIWRGLTRGQA